MSNISNGAPRYILNGIRDESVKAPVPVPEVYPQNLPHVYILAERGTLTPQLLDPTLLTEYYGAKSFDNLSKYWTMGTAFANVFAKAANTMLVQRVHPADALKPSMISIGIEIVDDQLHEYDRDEDGFPKIGADGNYVIKETTVNGKLACLVVNRDVAHAPGGAKVGKGQMTSSTGAQSEYYPLIDLEVASPGAYGNNIGISLYAPNAKSENPLNVSVAVDQVAQLYRLGIYERPNSQGTPVRKLTRSRSSFIDFSFKKSVVDKATTYKYDFDLRIKDWALDQPGMIPLPGLLGKTHVYRDNLDTVLKMIYTAEKPNNAHLIPADHGAEQQINLLSGVDFYGRPYYNFRVKTSAEGGINMNEIAIYYAEGGSDGDLSDRITTYNKLVKEQFDNYGELEGIEVLDDARYPQSSYWDAGYDIETKKSMISLLGKRKDIVVYLGTFIDGHARLTGPEQRSMGASLRTYAQLYPESALYGTTVTRAVIFMQSGRMAGEDSDEYYPHLLDHAYKRALYAGSGTGVLKTAFAYDDAKNNNVQLLTDMDLLWEPDDVRDLNWNAGLNYASWQNRSSAYVPHVQSIYDNDTSVLRDEIPMTICVDITKQCERAYRALPVDTRRTTNQTLRRLNLILQEMTKDKYDGRADIKITAYRTIQDANARVRYSCDVSVALNKGMYIGSFTVITRNREDLDNASV